MSTTTSTYTILRDGQPVAISRRVLQHLEDQMRDIETERELSILNDLARNDFRERLHLLPPPDGVNPRVHKTFLQYAWKAQRFGRRALLRVWAEVERLKRDGVL